MNLNRAHLLCIPIAFACGVEPESSSTPTVPPITPSISSDMSRPIEDEPLLGNTLLSACNDSQIPEVQRQLELTYGPRHALLCSIVTAAPKEMVLGHTCPSFLNQELGCRAQNLAPMVGLLTALGENLSANSPSLSIAMDQRLKTIKSDVLKTAPATSKTDVDAYSIAEAHMQSLWSFRQSLSILNQSTCQDTAYHVALDVGHAKDTPGARSARGRTEYEFNLDLVDLLEKELEVRGVRVSRINPSGGPFTLSQRKQAAKLLRADFLLSIHHDSVQSSKLSEWMVEGKSERYCDLHRGYSFFYSQSSHDANTAITLAKHMGTELNAMGFSPTFHHAENIPGENRELTLPTIGLYRRDGLGVLRNSAMPSLLFEAGVIVHREEELALLEPMNKAMMAISLAVGISSYCHSLK